VQFGLKFESQGEDADDFGEDDEETIEVGPVANPPRPTSLTEKPKLRGAGSEPDIAPAKLSPARKPAADRNSDAAEPPVAGQESKDDAKQESKVVSIDAFRKKT
jgi:hypothetical protein